MAMHAKLIIKLVAGFVASNGLSILAGMYLDYRFDIIKKVEAYVIKALKLFKA